MPMERAPLRASSSRSTRPCGERRSVGRMPSRPNAKAGFGPAFREFGLCFNPLLAIPRTTWIPYYGMEPRRSSLAGHNSDLGGTVTGATCCGLLLPRLTVSAWKPGFAREDARGDERQGLVAAGLKSRPGSGSSPRTDPGLRRPAKPLCLVKPEHSHRELLHVVVEPTATVTRRAGDTCSRPRAVGLVRPRSRCRCHVVEPRDLARGRWVRNLLQQRAGGSAPCVCGTRFDLSARGSSSALLNQTCSSPLAPTCSLRDERPPTG